MPLYPVPDLHPALPEIFTVCAAMALLMIGVFRGEGSTRLVSWLAVGVLIIAAYLTQSLGATRQVGFYGLFVSTVGGPDGRGWRVFPFYGTKEIAGRERTRYVLWPFHLRSELLVPGYGWETRRIDFPVFSAIDGAQRWSRSYALGAYTHTVDQRRGYEAVGAPWPLVFRDRVLGEEHYRTWRFAPFYGRSDRDGIVRRFYAWPAWRTTIQDADDFHYERRDALLVVWRREEQESAVSGHRRRLLTLFPALRADEHDGRALGQAPALFDSILPENRGLHAVWAPLWGLVRWDTEPDGRRRWNVLWGLVAREDGRLVGPWHLALGAPSVASRADDEP